MGKRGNGASWATTPDRETPALELFPERSAGMMLSTFRARWEDHGPGLILMAGDERFVSGDEAGAARASISAQPSATPSPAKIFDVDGTGPQMQVPITGFANAPLAPDPFVGS